MAHARTVTLTNERLDIGSLGSKFVALGGVLALLGLGGGAALGAAAGDGWRHFFHTYLVAFAYFLSISLGALFFVTVQHLTRAGWSVAVRRVAEILAANVVTLALPFLVLLIPVIMGSGTLYIWADAEKAAADHILHEKHAYLNPVFFAIRGVLYFVIWGFLARTFLRRSTEQDTSGDPAITLRMERLSAPGMILFALTLTFASFDLVMSVDPYWFSTMFGVYYFAGATMSFFALASVLFMMLQRSGVLATAVSTEHYHDLGKFLFAFVFFWGYIAFSQYMLIWYGNIPEETAWLIERQTGPWAWLGVVLIVGHFALPFVGLMSRYVKRARIGLAFWAIWLLAMHYVDLYWLIMPQLSHEFRFGLIDIALWVGMAGLYFAGFGFIARGRNLVPLKDPRLGESLSFENV